MPPIPWVRAVALAVVPLVVAAAAGCLVWLVLWTARPGASTLAEAAPGVLLAIGLLLGGRFEGAFVHLQSDGYAVVALLVPLLAGLLIARWMPWVDRHVLAAAGFVVTAGFHAALLGGASWLEVYDPTSFQTAGVVWNATATAAFAGVTWATAWAVVQLELARTVWVGVGVTSVLGSIGFVLSAPGADPGALATAATAGLLLGPNVLLLAVPGALGAGFAAGDVGASVGVGFPAIANEFGWWLWAVAFAGIGLLVLAAWRAEVPDSGIGFAHRVGYVAGAALAAIVAATVFAAPRLSSDTGSDAWRGLAGGPWALWPQLLLLAALVLVPLVARAQWLGETWPGAPFEALRRTAERVRTSPQPPAANTAWNLPPTASGPSPSPPSGVPPGGGHVPAHPEPPGQHASPAPAAPVSARPTATTAQPPPHNPFDDAAPPPVNDAWSDVPTADGGPAPGSPPPAGGQR